ncbi:IclR family transcriptional regulator [Acrocarpospora pleiomorpha]|nr:IclR family transcriptional regulator [Acrocarpospora pleiomorpha]
MTVNVEEKVAPSMVQRMTLIMETFEGRGSRRSLEYIATLTGLPRSTAHRILDQLVRNGWLQHDESGYHLGWRASHLAGPSDDVSALREVAAPFLHELVMRTGLVVHLAILDGPSVLYLDKLGGPVLPSVPSRVGGRLPAHLTAVGKAMLARIEPETVERLLDQLAVSGVVPMPDIAGLHRELSEVRSRGGLAFAQTGLANPISCVGAPASMGALQAGISLCDGGQPVNLERFAPLLLDRARRIAGTLEFAPGRRVEQQIAETLPRMA